MFTSTAARPATAEPAEWGPAKHDPEHPLHREASGLGTALRDDADARPDDN